jgi:hypothetical protein
MYICQCFQCGGEFEDLNPGEDSTPLTFETKVFTPLVWDEKEQAYVCPICFTDGFLIDI